MNINTDGVVGTIDIGPRDVEDWRECAVVMRADEFSAEEKKGTRIISVPRKSQSIALAHALL